MPQKKKIRAKASTQKVSVEVHTKSSHSKSFYPHENTVFIHGDEVFVVEAIENLSVLSDETKDVACHSLSSGYKDFPNWIDLVTSGDVQVVWCPKRGRVASNKTYLGS